ncbi:5607_t:CDS:1 [Funneliformis caledonium]|uniref:5607_t:CDS:1 n=1 Tax=Funneliformis caledonium TaxID=1117310 RepID=A0A9N9D8X8_9GLOM|nr:5607_t:CDS:1 [Funneliformis caledonium]
MAVLVDDCLLEIFEYLENDPRSLHFCVLVNRQWCQHAIPVLWRNPWKYRQGGCLKNLIDIYISTLPEKTQNKLSVDEIIEFPLFNKLTFEYSKFLQSIVLSELDNDIRLWVHNQPIRIHESSFIFKPQRKRKAAKNHTKAIWDEFHEGDDGGRIQRINYKANKKIITYELLKFFLVNSTNIDTLYASNLSTRSFYYIMEIIEWNPITKNRIDNLRQLQFGSNVIHLLPRTLCNVEYLEIENCNLCSDGLRNFINAQNNLKELNVKFSKARGDINKTSDIISSKESITRLIINDSPGICLILKGFENLTELIITYTEQYTVSFWKHMAKASLRNLKKLIINHNYIIYYDLIAKFIDSSSCDLEQFIINTKIQGDQSVTDLYIKSISRHCPSLKVFQGVISVSNLSEFSQLLKCTNLKILHLYPTQKMCQFDSFMEAMMEVPLDNLSRLYLETGWKLMKIEIFKNFMNKRNSLELKPISFHCHKNFVNRRSIFLNLCEDYKRKDYLLDYHLYGYLNNYD